MQRIRIVYDGDCPFCSRYVRLMRLRESFDVMLVNARADDEARKDLARRGFDLNAGMVVELDGRTYHGSDAVWVLSVLSDRSTFWNGISARVLASRRMARLIYPVLRLGRRLTLRLLGRERV